MEWLNVIFERVADLLRWWVVIAPWERGLRVRLGKKVEEVGAGVHLRIPLVDRFYVQSVRRRTIDTQPQTVTTADGHALTFSGVVEYEIVDLRRLYETMHQPEDTIIDVASAAASEYVSARSRGEISPEGLGRYVSHRLKLDESGLKGGAFRVVDFAFVRTYRLLNAQRNRITYDPLTMSSFDA